MPDEEYDELLKTFLNLEEIDTNIYRSTHQLPGRKDGNRVYGGQVVGQALMAANKTIDAKFHPHSIHCQFIAAGDVKRPLIYDVTRVRDGRSFCARLVKALQNGQIIFTTIISFHVVEAASISHQTDMPKVPPPKDCEDSTAFFERLQNRPETFSPGGLLAIDAYKRVLDLPPVFKIKFINPLSYVSGPVGQTHKFAIWVRSNTTIGSDEHLHHCVAAFISDVAPVGTPIVANAYHGFRLGMAASLDHSMWIHLPDFRVDDDWLLYETESTVAANGRALIHGKMWTTDGRMVLSTAQEIVVRGTMPKKDDSGRQSPDTSEDASK